MYVPVYAERLGGTWCEPGDAGAVKADDWCPNMLEYGQKTKRLEFHISQRSDSIRTVYEKRCCPLP